MANRQFGIGKFEYNLELNEVTKWKDYFLTTIQPMLEGFLIEPRYKIPFIDQQLMIAWLNKEKEKLQI